MQTNGLFHKCKDHFEVSKASPPFSFAWNNSQNDTCTSWQISSKTWPWELSGLKTLSKANSYLLFPFRFAVRQLWGRRMNSFYTQTMLIIWDNTKLQIYNIYKGLPSVTGEKTQCETLKCSTSSFWIYPNVTVML